ncbi:NAD-dependent epimerase/dehydratase family protein [Salimicrobium halophilum]|uniref:UDP-glucose 4-epimerase n=1 Tax=Salimicrobium halophilum TaxID=86666 RepID=A0A1G8SBN4_9BACI|nr:NAD-dependent epimerase/dehydratase family protein [Salimicrobium halophilum]SDJ26614.1 UDP-glucose 4-epimerase [Salimicrobium halophilum]
MKVLITGGAGFIGSHIAEELLEAGYEVVIVDLLITGKKTNIPLGARFYKRDIREKLDDIFQKEQPDYVIHQAAQVSVGASMKEPVYDSRTNVVGTVNLLQACVTYKVKKFVFASSAAVYGNPEYLPIDENHSVSPLSFYGLSKWTAEMYIRRFSDIYGLSYTILRYANVYGMRQDTQGEAGVIAIFTDELLHGRSPVVFGDGGQTRDFIFVKDVARANRLALEAGDGETINVGSGSRVSLIELIRLLENTMAQPVIPVFEEEREGDIRESVLANQKAADLLGWQQRYSLAEGISRTVTYRRSELFRRIS